MLVVEHGMAQIELWPTGSKILCCARYVIAARVFKLVGSVQFEISKSLELYVSRKSLCHIWKCLQVA